MSSSQSFPRRNPRGKVQIQFRLLLPIRLRGPAYYKSNSSSSMKVGGQGSRLRQLADGSVHCPLLDPDTPDQVLVRVEDEALALMRKTPAALGSSVFFGVLRTLAQHGLELDGLPALVDEALAAQRGPRLNAAKAAVRLIMASRTAKLGQENRRWS